MTCPDSDLLRAFIIGIVSGLPFIGLALMLRVMGRSE